LGKLNQFGRDLAIEKVELARERIETRLPQYNFYRVHNHLGTYCCVET
jgi:hypothetical protein